MASLNQDIIKRIPINLPSRQEQDTIVEILSAYDDLIENNLRRIRILEEMAQNLYREWFVKFRFPGHQHVKMIDSPLGKIPVGWELKRLRDILELKYGKALKAEDRIEGDVPVYGSSGIVGYHNFALVKGPGLIVGRKGNVGSIHWSDCDFYPIDTVYYVSTATSLHYIHYNLQCQNFINNDAAVPGLNREQAYSLPFNLPGSNILEKFSETVIPMFEMRRILERKISSLQITRDMLLPYLMSGRNGQSEMNDMEESYGL